MIAACLPSVSAAACFQGKHQSEKSAPPGLEIAGRIAICARPLPGRRTRTQPVKIAMIEGLSGAFANTGEAVFRNLVWAVERVNQRGGVKHGAGHAPAATGRATTARARTRRRCRRCARPSTTARSSSLQGNSSATAAALIDAINKHNEREPGTARAVPELLGGGPHPHQREVQLLALPLRRPCRHAHGRADGGAARTTRRVKSRLPDRAGLQLRPGGAARGAPPARRAAPRRADRRRRTASAGAREGLRALRRQDQGQRRRRP